MEGNDVLLMMKNLLKHFDEYFVNIVPSLGITSFRENNNDVNNNYIDNTVTKFKGHPSIVATTEQMKKSNKTFTFQNVSTEKVISIIKKLNTKKASKSDGIPTTVIKEFRTFFC